MFGLYGTNIGKRIVTVDWLVAGEVVNYSMPEEPTWHVDQDLRDMSYDGQVVDGIMRGGVGRLVDGTYGGDNFKLDIGYGKGNIT